MRLRCEQHGKARLRVGVKFKFGQQSRDSFYEAEGRRRRGEGLATPVFGKGIEL
jgi:hypothetical protein